VRQDVLRRWDTALRNFFEKLAKYPRFKDRCHYLSFTYPQVEAVKKIFSRPKHIYLSPIGFIKLNIHRDFLHKVSTDLVRESGLIVMEDLRTKNLVRHHYLAKSLSDAGWGMFQTLAGYKVQKLGKTLVLVDPAGTSPTGICGTSVPKDLGVRMHQCPVCGLVADRDVVSARVIEQRGGKVGWSRLEDAADQGRDLPKLRLWRLPKTSRMGGGGR